MNKMGDLLKVKNKGKRKEMMTEHIKDLKEMK